MKLHPQAGFLEVKPNQILQGGSWRPETPTACSFCFHVCERFRPTGVRMRIGESALVVHVVHVRNYPRKLCLRSRRRGSAIGRTCISTNNIINSVELSVP